MGLPLGVLSAVKRGSIWDYAGRTVALVGQALPPFWLGIMLVLIFAVDLDWLPTGRKGGISHYILPSLTLGWGSGSALLRLTRSAMLEVLDTEYVKLARAKGVKRWRVIWKHALKNAIITPLTYVGLLFTLSRLAGDPRLLYVNEYTTTEDWDAMGKAMGLDKPLALQYVIWVSKAVRGDFGRSLRDQINALEVIVQRVPATLQLTAGARHLMWLPHTPLWSPSG